MNHRSVLTMAGLRRACADPGCGNTVLLDGHSFSSGYTNAQYTFTPVSNAIVEIAGGKKIVTVVDLGGTGGA